MPKATLTYDLDNPDDARAHRLALDGEEWASLVWDFDSEVLRNIDRGKTDCPWATGVEAVQAIRDKLYDMIRESGLDIEDGLV